MQTIRGKWVVVAFLSGLSVTALAREAKVCGDRGSIEERVADCAETRVYENEKGEKYEWRLVSRTKDGHETWRDETPTDSVKEHIIWSDIAENTMNHWFATQYCADGKSGVDQKGGIHAKFRLPESEEFIWSERHGLRKILPNMEERSFWAGDFVSEGEALVFENGGFNKINRASGLVSVRCALRQ